jgi:GntR family transcriptional regulator/MocR family aminotransferase
VIVMSGAQQAVDLVGRVLLDPGDGAVVEEPGYLAAKGALAACGARLVPGPVDSEGLAVPSAGARLRLAYVTPSHQFPLGVTMSLARRLALLAWAKETGAWIVEDDYDSELRYASRPLPALQGLDTHERVVYVGTFSKVLFPSLRLAYVVVPHALLDAFRAARHFACGPPATLEQLVLADFLAGGHLERHLRRMRTLYAERQEALVAAAARHLRGLLEVSPADGGMHLPAWLPPGADDREAARRAAEHGVDTLPLSAFAARPPARGALLLGYAAVRPAEIEDGARRLARTLERRSRP